MPTDYRKTVGWLELQLAADKLQRDQAVAEKQRQERVAGDQQGFDNALKIGSQALAQENDKENRKLQLAGLMQRAAESNAVKEQIAARSDATKNRQITTTDENTDAKLKSQIEEWFRQNVDRDALRGQNRDIAAAELDAKIRGQDVGLYSNVLGKGLTPDQYGKRPLSLSDSFIGGLGGVMANRPGLGENPEDIPASQGEAPQELPPETNRIPWFEQSRMQPRLGQPSFEAEGAEPIPNAIPGEGVPAPIPNADPNRPPEVTNLPAPAQTSAATLESPVKLTQPSVPNPDVEAVETDKQTVDLAMKNMVQGQSTLNAFKKAREKLESIPEGDFGFLARSKELRLPKGIPIVGNLGVTVPGRNALEEGAVDMGLADSFLGRKLIQSFRGNADQPDPGVESIKKRVIDRDVARAAAQDLSSQIGLMRLGTTSTAAQDARIDRILGMLNDEAFGKNKDRTLAIMKEAEKEVQRLQRYYQFIAKNHMLPVGEIPDPEELNDKATKTKQQGLPPLAPSGL